MTLIEVRESTIHGQGAFATRAIAVGEIVHAIDDSRVVDREQPIREDLGEDPEHRDYLPDGTTVLMRKPAGYVNHSCAPNVYVYSVRRRRFILAMRDIATDEELLFDYSINAIDGDVWVCQCKEPICRGRHRCDFFALPSRRQLEYLPFLDPWFAEVHAERVLGLLAPASGRAPRQK